MYTCQVCNYSLTISKITTTNQSNMISISDPNDYIKMFIGRKKKIDSSSSKQVDIPMELTFDLNSLNTQMTKSGLKPEMVSTITNNFNLVKKNMRPNTFCLKCSQCNEIFILPPGKLSTIKLKKISSINNVDNVDEIITDYTLPRTKDFICPNKDCKIDEINKEAVIYRPNPEEYITRYICTNCKTIF